MDNLSLNIVQKKKKGINQWSKSPFNDQASHSFFLKRKVKISKMEENSKGQKSTKLKTNIKIEKDKI